MAETVYVPVNGQVTFGLHLVEDGASVAGQSPTVEIRRVSDGYYFDHSAGAAPYFKNVGGTKEGALTAETWLPGLYTLPWDQSVFDPDNSADYVVIYRNTAANYEAEVIENYCFQSSVQAGLDFICKILKNNSTVEIQGPTQVLHTWFDNDGTTPILKHKITQAGAFENREIEP